MGEAYRKNFLSQHNQPKGMVKSGSGFKVGRIRPYFQAVDFVYGETTCVARKKTWEILERSVPTHVMEIRPMKRERDWRLWIEAVKDFTAQIESVSGKRLTMANLKTAVKVMNDKRRALQRLNRLRSHAPAPISGRCPGHPRLRHPHGAPQPEAAQRRRERRRGRRQGRELHRHALLQGPHGRGGGNLDGMLERLTDRYMKIDCSCFTPNDERPAQVAREARESNAQGVVLCSLQFFTPTISRRSRSPPSKAAGPSCY